MKIKPALILAMVIGVSWAMVVSGLGYDPISSFWNWVAVDFGGLILIFAIMGYIQIQKSV